MFWGGAGGGLGYSQGDPCEVPEGGLLDSLGAHQHVPNSRQPPSHRVALVTRGSYQEGVRESDEDLGPVVEVFQVSICHL